MAGLRLKAARLALGIERADVFAIKLAVSETAYGNYERGVRLPDPYMLVRLLQLTGIGPDWVYGGFRGGVPFDLGERLVQAAAEVGAVIGGPNAEWPMTTAGKPVPRPTPAIPHRRPKHQLHEPPPE